MDDIWTRLKVFAIYAYLSMLEQTNAEIGNVKSWILRIEKPHHLRWGFLQISLLSSFVSDYSPTDCKVQCCYTEQWRVPQRDMQNDDRWKGGLPASDLPPFDLGCGAEECGIP